MRRSPFRLALAAGALTALAALPASAQRPTWTGFEPDPGAPPTALREVGFDQKIGDRVPLDLAFENADGETVVLGDLLGDRPLALSLVYYDCPMLCPMTLEGLSRSFRGLSYSVGREFDAAVVSFAPGEGAELAGEARERTLRQYGRLGSEDGWHFLTGDAASITALTEAVGFRYTLDEETGEYAHPAGLVILTPEGRIARYFFGIDHGPKDLRLGLVEAADGRLGSPVDQVLLYCYRYDPVVGRYTTATMNLLRLGGVLTLLALGSFVGLMLWRERRARRAAAA